MCVTLFLTLRVVASGPLWFSQILAWQSHRSGISSLLLGSWWILSQKLRFTQSLLFIIADIHCGLRWPFWNSPAVSLIIVSDLSVCGGSSTTGFMKGKNSQVVMWIFKVSSLSLVTVMNGIPLCGTLGGQASYKGHSKYSWLNQVLGKKLFLDLVVHWKRGFK